MDPGGVEPAYGAVLMAADLASLDVPAQRLRESGPDHAFFSTAEVG